MFAWVCIGFLTTFGLGNMIRHVLINGKKKQSVVNLVKSRLIELET